MSAGSLGRFNLHLHFTKTEREILYFDSFFDNLLKFNKNVPVGILTVPIQPSIGFE
jgi:hypothetical protein